MRRLQTAFAALIVMTLSAAAQEPPSRSEAAPIASTTPTIVAQSGDTVALTEANQEMTFVSGGEVRIGAQVGDDIFAAGGELRVDGASADHLLIGGGDIEIAPGAIHDIIAAGGRMRLVGPVVDDIVAVGGDIELRSQASVGGSAVLAGGRVRIGAPITGALRAAGGRLVLDASVGGDAALTGEDITLGPNARIGGDLRVRADTLTVDPGAVITGRTIREEMPRERHGLAASVVGVALIIFSLAFLGCLLLNGLIAAALPVLAVGGAQCLRTQILSTLGIGALVLLVGPLVVGILFATIIGAPLALFLLAAYLTSLPLAYAIVAYWLGQAMRRRLARRSAETLPSAGARFGWTLFGAFVLTLACFLPFLGPLAWLLTIIAGIGAAAIETWESFSRSQAA
jgi:hypothetical protein